MKLFFTIVKSDYLQRTRSYAFLITLCASLAIAYTFVPAPNANYSTIRISGYVGYYNSAWIGYVTAIMTSIFLSLIGFYLINSGIKKDIETKVGQIVASTPISNFKYLMSKMLSNFMLLLTLVGVIFIMSIILFVLYNDGFPFELFQFIKPYLLITIPAIFFISMLAVVFEVFLGRYSVLQNIGFFFLFAVLLVYTPKTESQYSLDIFGSRIVVHKLEEAVKDITNSDEVSSLNIGYALGQVRQIKKFEFNGIDFPTSFIISRFLLMLFSSVIIVIISIFFQRFDRKERLAVKRFDTVTKEQRIVKEVLVSSLPKPQISYSMFPLLKTEFLMLIRKGKKWLWFINVLGMVLLAILPIKIAHQIVLPILWFLQVSRLSDLTTKETTNNVHYFAFTSFKPITRLLVSQVFAGIFLMLLLASPLLIRLGLSLNISGVLALILGGIFIVMLASLLGILSKGKKLFEVLFFMVSYAIINGVPFVDYFGGFDHSQYYLIQLAVSTIILGSVSFLLRKNQLNK